VYLYDGTITDGAVAASDIFWAYYGEIDASLSGSAPLYKNNEPSGATSIQGVPTNAVVIGALSDSSQLTGNTSVVGGTLIVNGILGAAATTVSVGPGATLGGTGSCLGTVTINSPLS